MHREHLQCLWPEAGREAAQQLQEQLDSPELRGRHVVLGGGWRFLPDAFDLHASAFIEAPGCTVTTSLLSPAAVKLQGTQRTSLPGL